MILSDRNNFCEYVVLDSFNIAYRDEDIILDQIKKIYLGIFIMMILDFKSDCRKVIYKETQHKELIKLGFSATVVLVPIFV